MKLLCDETNRDGAHNYTYDTLTRLVEALNPLPSNPQESYIHDPVRNQTNSNQNGLSSFNQANQLLEDANFTYQYGNNGNMTRKTVKVGGTVTTYEYDTENKLVRVVSNGTTSNYKGTGTVSERWERCLGTANGVRLQERCLRNGVRLASFD